MAVSEERSETNPSTCNPDEFWVTVLVEPLKFTLNRILGPISEHGLYLEWLCSADGGLFLGLCSTNFEESIQNICPLTHLTCMSRAESDILGMCALLPCTPVCAETPPHLYWWMKTREARFYSLIITKISIVALKKSWHLQVWTDSCNITRPPFLFINWDSISFHLFHLPTAKAY